MTQLHAGGEKKNLGKRKKKQSYKAFRAVCTASVCPVVIAPQRLLSCESGATTKNCPHGLDQR